MDKFYLRLPRETFEITQATYLELVNKGHESLKVERESLVGGRAYIIEIVPGWNSIGYIQARHDDSAPHPGWRP